MQKIFITVLLLLTLSLQATDALPSWNEGTSKQSIINYVTAATKERTADFIPVKDRIVVFDNDGTLWSERPVYFQLYFAMDRVKEHGLVQIVNATHSGMDNESFKTIVKEWLKTAKHPTSQRTYSELIYQPMMELITYLNMNDFKVYIVSGGGIDFMRSFIPEVYGIPEEHIIGSSGKVHYKDGQIIKDPAINYNNDKEAKPIAIYYAIGKHPVAAFGNSDGDFAMMLYTEANKKHKTLQLYVHHTDEKREWAYDRKSHIGKLDKGLDYGKEHNWTIMDMKNDWKVIYPFELNKKD